MASVKSIVTSSLLLSVANAQYWNLGASLGSLWPDHKEGAAPYESKAAQFTWPIPSHYSFILSWGFPFPQPTQTGYTALPYGTSTFVTKTTPSVKSTSSCTGSSAAQISKLSTIPTSSSTPVVVIPSSTPPSSSSARISTVSSSSVASSSTVVSSSIASSAASSSVLIPSSTPASSSALPSSTPSSSASSVPVSSSVPATSTTSSAVASTSSSVAPGASPLGNITCPTGGVHIIASRGSLEEQGIGHLQSTVNNITERIPGSNAQALVYPAVLFPYVDSESAGVQNLTLLLMQFKQVCPNSKYVLLGWSQGGQVSLDTLCGNSAVGFNNTAPIDQQYTQNMVGAVLYGEPSFQYGQPYDYGTANSSGIFGRSNLTACAPYYTRVRSYCDYHDTYCTNYNASGLAIHFGYFDKYDMQAADWIASQFRAGQ